MMTAEEKLDIATRALLRAVYGCCSDESDDAVAALREIEHPFAPHGWPVQLEPIAE